MHAAWPEAWTAPVKTRLPSAHDQQIYLGDVALLLQWRKGLAGLSPGPQATESKGLGHLHGYSQMDFWARLLIGFGRGSELGARSGSPEKSRYSFHRPSLEGSSPEPQSSLTLPSLSFSPSVFISLIIFICLYLSLLLYSTSSLYSPPLPLSVSYSHTPIPTTSLVPLGLCSLSYLSIVPQRPTYD